MQEIQAHVIDFGKKSNKSNAQIAREANLSETTVRRFFAGEDSSVNTLVAIARVVGANDLVEYLPPKTAVAMQIVKSQIESELHPNSPHCATDCTARKAFNENLAHITMLYEKRLDERKELYEARLAERKELYERSLAVKNTQLDKKDAEIVTLNQKKDAEIVTLNQKHEAAIAALNADHVKELADVRARKDARIARFRWVSIIAVVLLVASLVHSVWAIEKIVNLSSGSAVEEIAD